MQQGQQQQQQQLRMTSKLLQEARLQRAKLIRAHVVCFLELGTRPGHALCLRPLHAAQGGGRTWHGEVIATCTASGSSLLQKLVWRKAVPHCAVLNDIAEQPAGASRPALLARRISLCCCASCKSDQ